MATSCAKCGAVIDPLAHACPYCGLTTPAGLAAHQKAQADAEARAAWQVHAEHLARSLARQAAQKTANASLLWSIAGTVLCCLPLGAVGIVQGLRARGAAKRAGAPMPGKAVLAVVLGVVSVISSASFVTWAIVRDEARQKETTARIATLEASSAAGVTKPTLDHDVACALAEIHARREGMGGHRGHTLSGFECRGELRTLSSSQARLEDFRFRPDDGDDDDKPFEVGVCFKRGARWYVTTMGKEPCEPPAP